MTKKDTTIAFYALINRLYSINYSSLRVYEQRRKNFNASDFKFAMPHEKAETWVDAKMSDINGIRAAFFENYNEANEINREHFILIDNELEKSKELLKFIHNVWYEKDGSFEDIFDGFLCKSPELLELLYIFEMKPFMTQDSAVLHLVDAYSSYIGNLFYKTITQSMLDIVDQLQNDFNSNGTPSLYSGVIKNNNVLKISVDRIRERRQQIEALHKELKSIKPKKYSGNAYTHSMCTNKYLELDVFLGQLEQRVKSANTDVVNTVSNKIVESTMDYLTGYRLDKKPEVNEIYVTESELSYIDYLKEMLEFGLASLKENQQQKQENKEKGETQ